MAPSLHSKKGALLATLLALISSVSPKQLSSSSPSPLGPVASPSPLEPVATVAIINATSTLSVAAAPPSTADCEIVAGAYKALQPEWTLGDGCKIPGVRVNRTNESVSVISITWDNQNLTGPLPAELFNLPKLTILSLYDNVITEFPKVITGSPLELKELQLGLNNLTEIPDSIAKLENLRELYLDNNDIEIVSSAIGHLNDLRVLTLSGNELYELPASIGDLSVLTYLSASTNHITSVPVEFGKLQNLNYLSFQENNLTSLPDALSSLTSLQYLSLHENQFSEVPPLLEELSGLTFLTLQQNNISYAPPFIGEMSKLRFFNLFPNPIANVIPFGTFAKIPSHTLSDDQKTSFLSLSLGTALGTTSLVNTTLTKRQLPSSVQTLSTAQLIDLCPLRDPAEEGEIAIGCLAGIVQYCSDSTTSTRRTKCRSYYASAFKNSDYAKLGETCPPWQSGPSSKDCDATISNYTGAERQFALYCQRSLFKDARFAPCFTRETKCRW